MEKFETPPDSPPITAIDPDDQPMWLSTRTIAPTPSYDIIQCPISNNFHIKGTHMQMIQDDQFDGRIRSNPHRHVADFLKISNLFQYGENQEEADDPTQEILDARGIFLYNTPNEAFKILEDKVLLKLDFSNGSQNPRPKTVVFVGGSNINPEHAILMEKFEALATKINSEFLIIRKELKDMRDGHRDNNASQIYMKDDKPMSDPMEANYVQGYHEGYHYRKPINSPKASTEEIMRELIARQTEANERMKNQVVELERKINQGLRNCQAIIQNLERQIESLKEKIQPTKSLPHTTNNKPRHEFLQTTLNPKRE
ncbi:hypothetical protein Tco_0636105 [Tanacetum coccineum]